MSDDGILRLSRSISVPVRQNIQVSYTITREAWLRAAKRGRRILRARLAPRRVTYQQVHDWLVCKDLW